MKLNIGSGKSEIPVNYELVDLWSILNIDRMTQCAEFVMIPIIMEISKIIDKAIDHDYCFVLCKIDMYYPDETTIKAYLYIEPYNRKVSFYIEVSSKERTTGITEANKQMAVLYTLTWLKLEHEKFVYMSKPDKKWINDEFMEMLDMFMNADSCGIGCLEGGDNGEIDIQLTDNEWTEVFDRLGIDPDDFIN